ncbi:MAG: branched-chain amino acid transporter permease [Deltaproteobacteria bacterium]|jgi:branched-chain amino acid transport system permease protein|nr:branched-chain amino acid transporter permease [Deltaproteobacteria bacterium]
MKNQKTYWMILVCVLPFLLAGLTQNIYYLRLFNLMVIYSFFALGLNILTGFTGITSFGHAGFFAVGAYGTALLSLKFGIPSLLAILLSSFMTALVGFAIGLPVIRISGIYLAMVTLGFAEFIKLTAINWEVVTGGPLGISNIPFLSIFGYSFKSEKSLFLFIYLLLLIGTFIFYRIIRSPYGQSLPAIKDDERAAQSVGIPCVKNKLVSFFISGFYSGFAGALYAHFDRFISPDIFSFDLSILVLCMVVVGGMGSILGSILGSIILVVLLEFLQPLGDYRLIVYGGLLMIMIMYFPQGLKGILASFILWPFRRRRGVNSGPRGSKLQT